MTSRIFVFRPCFPRSRSKSPLISVAHTVPPSRPNASAAPRPMPCPAAVTNAPLPSSLPAMELPCLPAEGRDYKCNGRRVAPAPAAPNVKPFCGLRLRVHLVLPVVLAGEVVGRIPGEAIRVDVLRVLLLALDDLLVERVLGRVFGRDLLPLVQEVPQDLVGSAVHLHALLEKVLAGFGRFLLEQLVADGGGVDSRGVRHRLQIGAELLPHILV